MQPLSPDGDHRGQLPPIRCQPLPASRGQADGLIRLSGRIPAGGDTQSIILSPGQRPSPAGLGKAGCSRPAPPAATAGHPAQKGHPPGPLDHTPHHHGFPASAAAIRDRDQIQSPQIQPPQPRATTTDGYRHQADRPAPEFDKGTLARTLIGLYGQVTSLPNRPGSLRVLAPCQIPALLVLSPGTHLRSPADAGKADTVCHVPDGADGGVCGCERTIGRAASAGSFHRTAAPSISSRRMCCLPASWGPLGGDACPVIEGHRPAGGGGLASITTTRRDGTRRTR
jgi:hypothetical protein